MATTLNEWVAWDGGGVGGARVSGKLCCENLGTSLGSVWGKSVGSITMIFTYKFGDTQASASNQLGISQESQIRMSLGSKKDVNLDPI